jgi:hypothetical protein
MYEYRPATTKHQPASRVKHAKLTITLLKPRKPRAHAVQEHRKRPLHFFEILFPGIITDPLDEFQ